MKATPHRASYRAPKGRSLLGSDSISLAPFMLKAGQKQIATCGAIHLPFQKFQPVDLTLCLAVGPRLTKRRRNRVEIGREAARKCRQSRRFRLI